MKLKYQIPELYHGIFPKFILDFSVTSDKATCDKATCDNCAMAPHKYKDNLKCCTYFPFQPNYLLGAVLSSDQIIGTAKNSIESKIANRQYALPIGILPSVRHQVRFNKRRENEFGNREDWLCPYYNRQNNNCGIWKFRSAVCTTYFCLFDHGKSGEKFWQSFQDYLTYVEMAILEEVLVILDFSPRQINDQLEYINRFSASLDEQKSDSLDEKLARKLWNGYFDDQVGFYKKCFMLAKNMKGKDFTELLGEKGAELQQDVISSLRKLEKK